MSDARLREAAMRMRDALAGIDLQSGEEWTRVAEAESELTKALRPWSAPEASAGTTEAGGVHRVGQPIREERAAEVGRCSLVPEEPSSPAAHQPEEWLHRAAAMIKHARVQPEADATPAPEGYTDEEIEELDRTAPPFATATLSERRDLQWQATVARLRSEFAGREREREALLRDCAALIDEAMIYTVRRNDGSAWMAGARALLARLDAHLGSGR